MKRGFAGLELCVKRGAVPSLVLLRDELGATETELRWTAAATRRKDRRVVDGHEDCLVLHWCPKRGAGDAVAEELDVL